MAIRLKKVQLEVTEDDAMVLVLALVEEAKDFDLGMVGYTADRKVIKDVIGELGRADQILKVLEEAAG